MVKSLIEKDWRKRERKSQYEYKSNLLLIETKKEEKVQKERDWANKEKIEYQRNFNKSMANREVQDKMKKEQDVETEFNLKRLEEKLNRGLER